MQTTGDHGRWRQVASVLLAEAERLTDPRARAVRLVEVGDLCRDKMGDAASAAKHYADAVRCHAESAQVPLARLAQLARDSGDPQVTARLVDALTAAERWVDVITVLVKQAEVAESPDERAALYAQSARLTRDHLDDADLARAYLVAAAAEATEGVTVQTVAAALAQALADAPSDDELAAHLGRIETLAGRPIEAMRVLTTTAAHSNDLQVKARLLLDAAAIASDHAGLPLEAAVHAYEALVLDPACSAQAIERIDAVHSVWAASPEVSETLAQIWERLQRHDKVHELLGLRLAVAGPEERPTMLLRLAEHAEYALLEPTRAFDLYRRALEEGQGDLSVFATGLRRVAAEGVEGAFGVMAPLFEAAQLWSLLLATLEDEAALAVDELERAELFFRAGAVAERHLQDYERAMEHFLQAFKVAPKDVRYVAAGERIYRRRGDWAMVDRLLDLQVRIVEAPSERRRLLLEQGRLRHGPLQQHWAAFNVARTAAAEGATEEASSLVAEIARDDAGWAAIDEGLRREAEAEGATVAARILSELATLVEQHRDRPEEALRVLREAYELSPEDPALFDRVAALVERIGSKSELATWLMTCAQRPLPDEFVVAALRRSAQVWEGALGRPDEAREALRLAASRSPQDPILTADLLQRARASQDPLPLAEVLARIAAGQLAPPPDLDHDGALLELSRVYEARLGDLEAAANCHETLLVDDPRAPVSLAWMRRRAEARGDHSAVVGLLERALAAEQAVGDTAGIEARLRSLAEVAEHAMRDLARAAGYLRALWDVTSDAAVRERLHGLYVSLGDRGGELRLLGAELDRMAERAETMSQGRALAERLAELAAQAPPDWALQAKAWRFLADLAPTAPEPLEHLARVLRAQGDFEAVLAALEARAALSDGLGALQACRERAQVLTVELSRLDEAVLAWRGVLESSPDDDEALRYLQGIHKAQGDFEAEVAVLEQRIAAAEDPDVRVALLHEAAVQAELRLGDAGRAVAALERVAEADPDDLDVADERLRLYADLGRHADYIALAEVRLKTLDDAEEQLDLARRIARTATTRSRDEAALLAWQRVDALRPGDDETLQAVAMLYATLGRSEDEAATCDLLARLSGDSATRRSWWTREAQAWERGERLAEAVDAWRKLNALAPEDIEVLVELRRVAGLNKDPWTVARALEAQLGLVDADARRGLERMLARVLDTLPDERSAAVALWAQISADVPDDEEALEALKAGYAALGQVPELVETLKRLIERATDDDERAARWIEAGRFIEAHKGDYAEAFKCWRKAFNLSGDADAEMLREMGRLAELGGLWDSYLKVLEVARGRATSQDQQVEVLIQQARVAEERLRSLDRAAALLAQAFDLQPTEGRALDELTRVGALRGDHEGVLEAYTRVLSGALERDARAGLLIRCAALLERHLSDPARAFEAYAQALGLGASEAAILPEIARVAEVGGLWDELTSLYRGRWERQSQAKAKVATVLELARVLEARCPDWERAFEQYLVALQIDPEDEVAREAAWRLAEAHSAWPIVARVLDLKAKDTEETWLSIVLLHDVARIQEIKLSQPEKAFETLRRAFALETWNETVLTALRRLAERLSRWSELASMFEDEAGWAQEPHARLRLYREAATLHGEHGQPAAAARILRHVVELDPQDDFAASSLARLLRELADWEGLATFLEARQTRGADEARAAMTRELAQVLADHLNQPRRAEQLLRTVVTQWPSDEVAFNQWVALLTRREEWSALAEAYETRARVTSGDERVSALRERARLVEARLESPVDAFKAWSRLAVEAPTDAEPVRAMARWVEAAAGYEELLAAAERVLPHVEPDAQPELLRLAGRLARDRFDNKKKAYAALSRALELDRNDRALAREVADLALAERRWSDRASLLERYGPPTVGVDGDDEQASTTRWALELAELRAERMGESEAALAGLQEALRAYPESVALLRRAHALAERSGRSDALVWSAASLARVVPSDEAVECLSASAATLERQGAADDALKLWQRVLRLSPTHEGATRAIRTHATRTRDWALLATELRLRVDALPAGKERVPLLLELAQIHRTHRGEPEEAEAALREALRWAPESREVLTPLVARVLERADPEDVDALAHLLLERTAAQTEDARDPAVMGLVADLQIERARQYAGRGDEAGALACLRVARARAPGRPDVALLLADALYRDGELAGAAELWAQNAAYLPAPEGYDAARFRGHEALKRGRAFRAVGEDARAIQAFEVSAQEADTRVDALEALANLQEKLERWEAAVRLREKVAEIVTSPVHKAAALVAAGTLLDVRLGKTARALAAYDKALECGLGDRALLQRLLTLYREHGRWASALVVARRLLDDERDDNLRAELHCAEGALLIRLQRIDEGRQAFERALAISPLLMDAARGLIELLAEVPAEVGSATLRTLWRSTADVQYGDKRPLLALLGATLFERDDLGGAIEVYEELHLLDPKHTGAQDALAALYARLATQGVSDPQQAEHFDRAIRHRLAHVRSTPGEAQALRELIALYRAAGHPDWAVTPLRLLNLLKASTREESELARALSGPLDDALSLHFSAGTRHELVIDAVSLRTPIHVLMESLYESVRAALDEELSACRVEDTEPAEFALPTAVELVGRMAAALELDPPALWVRAADGQQVLVERLAGGGEWVVDRGLFQGTPQRDLRFHLARALEMGRGASSLLIALGDDEAAALFVAAMAIGLGDAGADYAEASGVEPDAIGQRAEFLVETLSEDELEALAHLAPAVQAQGPGAFALWAASVRRRANRVGFVLCGDLARALVCGQRYDAQVATMRVSGPETFRGLLDASEAARDVFAYAFGSAFHGLLRTLPTDDRADVTEAP